NQDLLWKIYRSLFYYQQHFNDLTADTYGANGIEIILDGKLLSKKHNNFYFLNNRQSIYEQMTYQKNSMLFEWLNSLQNKVAVSRQIEKMDDEFYKLNFILQKQLHFFANNIQIDFTDFSFLDLLKNHLQLEYTEKGQMMPLAYMSTEELIDEYLNLLDQHLSTSSNINWLVIYHLESFLASRKIQSFIENLKHIANHSNL
ncbi:hypothetical protein EQ500_11040, partial [Lactobacillus sp. XV13L]|nr:hypothetical protein [Lactobacillus sp. XV13L]